MIDQVLVVIVVCRPLVVMVGSSRDQALDFFFLLLVSMHKNTSFGTHLCSVGTRHGYLLKYSSHLCAGVEDQ